MDKNLSADFTCKSRWNSCAWTVVFANGVIVGMMLLAGSADVVSFAGYIVAGNIAKIAILNVTTLKIPIQDLKRK